MLTADPIRHHSLFRQVVLGTALVAGLVMAAVSGGDFASVTGPSPAPAHLIAAATAADLVRTQAPADGKAPAAPEAPKSSRNQVDAEISIGPSGIVVRKIPKGEGREVDVEHDFDSFEQFIDKAPWIAGLVFGVTALLLLAPVLIVGLIIWYKVRSNRMRNETMLKLAERGVVPTTEALAAVASNRPSDAIAATPSAAPLYEQARQMRKRAAWSDLRKGVVMGAIGLGLSLYSMLESGEANGLGLVLLFVGAGYVVLWYFEDGKLSRSGETGPGSTPGA